jgi:hypothetical protein
MRVMLLTGRLVAVAVARIVSDFRDLGATVRWRDLRQAVANATRKVKARCQRVAHLSRETVERMPNMES